MFKGLFLILIISCSAFAMFEAEPNSPRGKLETITVMFGVVGYGVLALIPVSGISYAFYTMTHDIFTWILSTSEPERE